MGRASVPHPHAREPSEAVRLRNCGASAFLPAPTAIDSASIWLTHVHRFNHSSTSRFSRASVKPDHENLNTARKSLALPLLVARIRADNVNLAPSFYDFAIFTDSFDAGADLHRGFALKIFRFWKPNSIWISGHCSQGPISSDFARIMRLI